MFWFVGINRVSDNKMGGDWEWVVGRGGFSGKGGDFGAKNRENLV